MITIIVAVEENTFAIGKDNKLLYHIPADLKRFKELTTGNAVIMGWNTFMSLPNRPLPNRENIVISSKHTIPTEYMFNDNLTFVSSIEEAVDVANEFNEAYVIGGGAIYKQFIGIADNIDLTVIKPQTPVENPDTYFSDEFKHLYQLKTTGDKQYYNTPSGERLIYWVEQYQKI